MKRTQTDRAKLRIYLNECRLLTRDPSESFTAAGVPSNECLTHLPIESFNKVPSTLKPACSTHASATQSLARDIDIGFSPEASIASESFWLKAAVKRPTLVFKLSLLTPTAEAFVSPKKNHARLNALQLPSGTLSSAMPSCGWRPFLL